jgi:hypothetical protein
VNRGGVLARFMRIAHAGCMGACRAVRNARSARWRNWTTAGFSGMCWGRKVEPRMHHEMRRVDIYPKVGILPLAIGVPPMT